MQKIREFLKKNWKWVIPVASVLLVGSGTLVLVGTGVLGPASNPDSSEVVIPEEPSTPDAIINLEPLEERPEVEPEPAKKSELNIKSTKSMKYSTVWNPPDDGQYFWQVVDPNMGYPATGGTDYVLAHACEKQTCAGDKIREVEEGNTLQYKGSTYKVDDKISIMKDELPGLEIWEHHKGRLVIITCIIETTWWASDKNDVIIATKVN